jgi:pimeloyl-ACP methyl ester carboxylesterase
MVTSSHAAGKMMNSQTLTLPDKRQLGYAIEGNGKPVVYFHGTASSRLEILLLKQFAHQNSLQLIGIDRPGYGLTLFRSIGLGSETSSATSTHWQTT